MVKNLTATNQIQQPDLLAHKAELGNQLERTLGVKLEAKDKMTEMLMGVFQNSSDKMFGDMNKMMDPRQLLNEVSGPMFAQLEQIGIDTGQMRNAMGQVTNDLAKHADFGGVRVPSLNLTAGERQQPVEKDLPGIT